VAVIGTGASAIQFVPAIVPKVKNLTLFQRSAPYVIPKPDRAYSGIEQDIYKKWPVLQQASRAAIYSQHEVRALAFTVLQAALKPFEWQFKRHLNQSVKDPILRAKLNARLSVGL
jgi:cation diffusion facilitator CzcD-associated flavoprotein CzcO